MADTTTSLSREVHKLLVAEWPRWTLLSSGVYSTPGYSQHWAHFVTSEGSSDEPPLANFVALSFATPETMARDVTDYLQSGWEIHATGMAGYQAHWAHLVLRSRERPTETEPAKGP